MPSIYYQLLQWVPVREMGGADHDYKTLAVRLTPGGIHKAADRAQEQEISLDDLRVEAFVQAGPQPSEHDDCLYSLSYEEWLEHSDAQAA